MKIEDRFRVNLPVDEAWRVLLDIERIAPCMPGAELQEVAGDEYRGVVKVKVGPITAQYKGVAKLAEVDEGAHRAVIDAQGRDTRGQGNASATITMSLAPDGDGTAVSIDNDVTVTGKVAQFGRGVMADVSTKLLAQFVECLESRVLSNVAQPADGGETREVAPVDLLRTAGAPVLKRLVPAGVVLAAVVILLILLLR
ncbi:MAG TPA: SRPBCC family protein [Acidimicrobiia bacterium]|nr:SRPBCC family protein [Acidimicrobiia bacterium]